MAMFFQFATRVTMTAKKKESFEKKKTLNIGRRVG
jgi:hypothetical protein